MAKTVRWYVDHRKWCDKVQSSAQYRRERLGLAR
jgi:dTDP-D-glucose 4,6-dehydratase